MSVCDKFLTEDLRRCFVTQTSAWHIVEAIANECQIAITERERINVSGSQRLVRLLVFSTVPFARLIGGHKTKFEIRCRLADKPIL